MHVHHTHSIVYRSIERFLRLDLAKFLSLISNQAYDNMHNDRKEHNQLVPDIYLENIHWDVHVESVEMAEDLF